MKFPKRSLALFLVLTLLLGTNSSFSAQVSDPPTVIEFEPLENSDIAKMSEADLAEILGIGWSETASAVDFAAVLDIEWIDGLAIVDLREYNIVYGDLHLMYVTYFPLFGVGAGLPFDMLAGQAKPLVFQPWWHTNPDAELFYDNDFVNGWDIPGFEGIQWKSSDESVIQAQFTQQDIAAGVKNPVEVWLVGIGEGTAYLQLVLPNGIIVQLKVTVAPRPPAYPRPMGFLVNPSVVRLTAGQTASVALTCVPEEGIDGKLLLADWVSSDPAVATLDNEIITSYISLEEVPEGPLDLRVVGLSPGRTVVTVYVAAYDEADMFGLVGLDIYSFEVVVTAPSGGDDGDDDDSKPFFERVGDFFAAAWEGAVEAVVWIGGAILWIGNFLLQLFFFIVNQFIACFGSETTTSTNDRVTLNMNTMNHLTVDASIRLKATVTTSGSNKNVKWSVISGSNIVSVTNQGLVTGKAAGSATVRAELAANSNIYADCTVNVTVAAAPVRKRELLNNTSPPYSVQGLAVGTNYCYSFEVRNSDTEHRLYRFNMNSGGTLTQMTVTGPTLPPPLPALLHANDATLASYTANGANCLYMYVAAWAESGTNYIVKLEYNGSGQYWQEARYACPIGWSVGGVARKSGGGASSTVTLLLKRQNQFYEVSLNVNQTGSNLSIPASTPQKFSVSYGDYANYTPQSFHYEDVNGGTIYLPMWGYRENAYGVPLPGADKANENVILVYRNINNATGSNIVYDEVWTIKKGNSKNVVFEIEGCGFPQGRTSTSENNVFWFSANEWTSHKNPRILANGGVYTDAQNIK